jgi:hypothetical protein
MVVESIGSESRPSLLPKLDGFQKVVALGGAIVTVWGAVVTVTTTRNAAKLREIESRLTTLKEERSWAKELYSQFDAIVSKDASEQARIDRLAGLLALADLSDQSELKKQWARLIREQVARYETALKAKSPSPNGQVAAQLEQYKQLREDAAASVVESSPRYSNYDFDIFWCPGDANRSTAEAIARLKEEDPNSSGNWRLRAVSGKEPWVADKQTYSIVWDYEDERPIATALTDRLQKLAPAPMAGIRLRRLQSTNPTTRWYLSVFVCRPNETGRPAV